ncbi:MAG: hypothetical protein ABJN95_04160 [Maribacter sp.]|uniref:hypothetical protein n=1 Tax=Maribacter sp. TaxID=1897614 RepID=UPI003297A909
MRTLVYILLSVLVGIFNTFAQEEASSKETDNEISFSFDGDISFSGAENMYFSTSDSDDTFKVRAKFPERKTVKIRKYLKEELGDRNMKISGSKQLWKIEYNGDTAYEIKVDDGSLRIFVDKVLVSSSMFNKLKTITKNIKNYTSGKSEEKREEERLKRDEERLEREAEQLMRDAERKMREAERLQREAERLKNEAARKTDQ